MRTKPNNKRKFWITAGFAAAGIFVLTGCTKSFCTNQDKANQLYAYYGDIYETSADPVATDTDDNVKTQTKNRETLYATLTTGTVGSTSISSTYAAGFALPTKTYQAYMEQKATDFASTNYKLWTDGTIDTLDDAKALKIAKHVGIYAGLTSENKVATTWTNMDSWYKDAVETIGYVDCPSSGFINTLKSTANNAISKNYSCITPKSHTFTQDGSAIYIEGKTWGQAFHEYGFFEGLFVFPFAWLIHTISECLGDTAWAQILAILVVTLIVRIVSVFSQLFQNKSTERQQMIQPELNALQAKFPNSNTDPDERRQMMMAQSAIMKKAKVHPLMPLLFLILQYPLFICIWSALQGSAALASGNVFNLSLTTPASTCFQNYADTPGALFGIIFFFITCIGSILASMCGMWFNSWKQKAGITPAPAAKQDANGQAMDPNRTMKIMSFVFIAFYIIMSWQLPVAMNIYFFLGSLITIIQEVLMEAAAAKRRHRLAAATGDGTNLAAIRRSKHNRDDEMNGKSKKKGKNDSDKPLWR
jgi:YidC/Oxa1 family membrane protein insertase